MKHSQYLIALLALINTTAESQVNSLETLVEKSRAGYTKLSYIHSSAFVKIKSSIANDTSTVTDECFLDKKNKSELFLLPVNGGIFIHKGVQYFFLHETGQFKKVPNSQRRYTIYNTRYKEYPFVNIDDFFNNMLRQKFAFIQTDSSYRLMNFTTLYEFDKTNYLLQKMQNTEYDHVSKGNYFKEVTFTYPPTPDSLIAETIADAIDIVSKKSNEATEVADSRPTFIDRREINDAVSRVAPGQDVAGKPILVDFFYQSCLPCIRSYPVMNDFYKCSGGNLIVVGIDPVLSDTLNMHQHIKRYNIQYPIITGKIATELSKVFKVSGYPTFAVIDPEGKITAYKSGHSSIFFKKVKRKYIPDCLEQ